MTSVAERPRCASCGALLSRYRAADEPDCLCAACARQAGSAGSARTLGPDDLLCAVASVLLMGKALGEGRVHVQVALAARGITADAIDVNKAVGKLRRRHRMRIHAVEREAGYELVDWPHRFTRRGLRHGRQRSGSERDVRQLEMATLESSGAGA